MSRYYDNIDVRNKLKSTNTENVELVGKSMNIDNLATTNLQVDNLDVNNIYSTNISSTNTIITNITATNITVQTVSSSDVKVTNLNTANITATNITTTFANSKGITLVADGTQALPSITFNGDNDTGINRIGEDTIAFSAAGVNRFIVSNNSITLKVPIVNTLAANAATPQYSFENDNDTGFYINNTNPSSTSFSTGGTLRTQIGANLVNLNNTKIITGNGTAADPPYTFVTDQNTGIFHGTNADEVGITTNDTQRLLLGNLSATANNPLYQEVTNVSASVISNISGSTGFLAYDKESQPIVSQETAKSLILNNISSSYVPVNGPWFKTAYSPSLNRWVAVNILATTTGIRLVYSNDGDNWTNVGVTGVPNSTVNFINSIDWSPLYGVFVFGLQRNTTNSIARYYASNDGINWNSLTLTFPITGQSIDNNQSIRQIRWIPEKNSFITAYGNIQGNKFNLIFLTSVTTTTAVAYIEEISSNAVIIDFQYITDFDMYCAVSLESNRVFYIRNLSYTTGVTGNVWNPVPTSEVPTAFSPNNLAYSKKLKLLIAVGLHSSNTFCFIVSTNGGVNWTTGNTTLDPTLDWKSVIWIDDIGAFYAVSHPKTASQQTKLAYSFDGYNWVSSVILSTNNLSWTSAVYSPEQGQLMITCRNATTSNTGILHTSPSSLFATPQSAFNNSSTINIDSNGQFNYIKGLSTNMGNIMDFYNPYRSDSMFPINTNDSTTFSGTNFEGFTTTMCIANNANIYMFPRTSGNTGNFNAINTLSKTIRKIPINSNYSFTSCVYHPSTNKIYCISDSLPSMTFFDLNYETFTYDALSTTITNNTNTGFSSGILGYDNNIYYIPGNKNVSLTSIGIFNPTTVTFNRVQIDTSSINTSGQKWFSGISGIDGNIYCGPFRGGENSGILKIDITTNPGTVTTQSITRIVDLQSGFFAGIPCISKDGKIWFPNYSYTSGISNTTFYISPPYSSVQSLTAIGSDYASQSCIYAMNGYVYSIGLIGTGTRKITLINPTTNLIDMVFAYSTGGNSNLYNTALLLPTNEIFISNIFGTGSNKCIILKIAPPVEPPWMMGAMFNKTL